MKNTILITLIMCMFLILLGSIHIACTTTLTTSQTWFGVMTIVLAATCSILCTIELFNHKK